MCKYQKCENLPMATSKFKIHHAVQTGDFLRILRIEKKSCMPEKFFAHVGRQKFISELSDHAPFVPTVDKHPNRRLMVSDHSYCVSNLLTSQFPLQWRCLLKFCEVFEHAIQTQRRYVREDWVIARAAYWIRCQMNFDFACEAFPKYRNGTELYKDMTSFVSIPCSGCKYSLFSC